ncbi:hypothetical protein HanRHA438_Chr09g0398951 [Helianthus annuus]|nr:hypothetical protein HanHA300_Chr09g0318011 [Helianthus annuus]KAJ0534256.1 hypothetical protein HanIR_Chr09g0417671 [Helianthus annuus]KAJ0542367.1 hypothetical protein HanHA89_Chr09g0338981 [Helianthus annuus]KAJ0707411.1 hypothetical protein HanLR1_Chr09g0318151 [Helianthus annuus]KAJ0711419.1 hypothetical protein HanOQP8_Chr09g0323661 [Helianthus annuus]
MQICGQVGGENELKFGTFARIGTVPVQNLNNTREYRYGIETREMGEHEID